MKYGFILAAPMFAAALSAHAETTCTLDTKGASSGTDDTTLIQNGIDTCAQHGGGTLKLAAKTYRISPVQLKSNVYLWLEPGTVLEASPDKSQYVAAFIGWPYNAREALISGDNITNSGILGSGVIDGNGQVWWDDARRQRKDGTMTKLFPHVPDANGMPRPWLVEFYQSSNITVDGVTLRKSPMWNLALRYSKGVKISNLTISNPEEAPNTDGIDLIASQDVDIRKVDISTGDDNITFKSGLAGFDMPAQATADIHVADAKLGTGHGVSIGSETLNGVNHITLERLSFEGTTNGFRIKTGRDRGADIAFISVKDVRMNHVGMPLSVTAYYPKVPENRDQPRAVTPTTPFIHDVSLENITATGAKSAGQFIGLPESPLKNFKLSNVSIEAKTGFTVRDAMLDTQALQLQVTEGVKLKQLENASVVQH